MLLYCPSECYFPIVIKPFLSFHSFFPMPLGGAFAFCPLQDGLSGHSPLNVLVASDLSRGWDGSEQGILRDRKWIEMDKTLKIFHQILWTSDYVDSPQIMVMSFEIFKHISARMFGITKISPSCVFVRLRHLRPSFKRTERMSGWRSNFRRLP